MTLGCSEFLVNDEICNGKRLSDELGGVVCKSDYDSHVCLWSDGIGQTNKQARQIIGKCILEHEETHRDLFFLNENGEKIKIGYCEVEISRIYPTEYPSNPENWHIGERIGYEAELACLERYQDKCTGVDTDNCIYQLNYRKNFVKDRLKKHKQ